MFSHLAIPFLAFLGPIGGPELIIILLVLAILVVPGVLLLVLFLRSNRSQPYTPASPPPFPTAPPSTQARLQELDSLKSQGFISESEYQEKRKQILGGL